MLFAALFAASALVGLALGQCLINFTKRMQIEAVNNVRRNRAHMRRCKRHREWKARLASWKAARGLA